MRRIALILLIGLLLPGCDEGIYSGTLIFEGEHQFGAGTHLPGDVYMRAGTAEFAAGSQIVGTVYIVGGTLWLNGEVGGDLAVLDGRVTLGPQANISGDLRIGGGTVQQAQTAVVEGETVNNAVALPLEDIQAATGWDDRLRVLSAALLLAAIGGLWASKRPQLLVNVGQTAVQHWLVAGAVGLLVVVVLPILLVIMAFTIVLLPLVLILAGLILLLLGYGYIALGSRLGGWLVSLSGRTLSRGWTAFGGTLLLLLLFNIPLVGDVLVGGTITLVLGVMLLTRFGLRRFTPPPTVAEDDLATYGRPRHKPL
jgi:hypothetical protein